jgi:hypothetical protein
MGYAMHGFQNNMVVDAADVLNHFDVAIYDLYECGSYWQEDWRNDNPLGGFDAQTVSIEYVDRPKFYEIEYCLVGEEGKADYVLLTGKLAATGGTQLQGLCDGTMRYREVGITFDDNKINLAFSAAKSGTSGTSAKYLIPTTIRLYY